MCILQRDASYIIYTQIYNLRRILYTCFVSLWVSKYMSSWVKYLTDEGKAYYYDEITMLTQWNKPDGYISDGERNDDTVSGEEGYPEIEEPDYLMTEISSLPPNKNILIKIERIYWKFLRSPSLSALTEQVDIDSIIGKLEELETLFQSGSESDWLYSLKYEQFVLFHNLFTMLLLNQAVIPVRDACIRCIAYAGNIHKRLWSEYIAKYGHQSLFEFTSVVAKVVEAAAITAKNILPRALPAIPYHGFDERDIKEYNLQGYEQKQEQILEPLSSMNLESIDSTLQYWLLAAYQAYAYKLHGTS